MSLPQTEFAEKGFVNIGGRCCSTCRFLFHWQTQMDVCFWWY